MSGVSPAPLRPGQTIRVEELEARVLETEGGAWTTAQFALDRPLGSPDVCLLVWKGRSHPEAACTASRATNGLPFVATK